MVGLKPDIAAPGEIIASALNKDYVPKDPTRVLVPAPNGYLLSEGTSMATPAVAGIIALMLERNPALTVEEIRTIFDSTSTKPAGAPGTSWGRGKVDALAAVAAVVASGGASDAGADAQVDASPEPSPSPTATGTSTVPTSAPTSPSPTTPAPSASAPAAAAPPPASSDGGCHGAPGAPAGPQGPLALVLALLLARRRATGRGRDRTGSAAVPLTE